MIRQAVPADRKQMAELVYVIFCDMELPLVSRYTKNELLEFVVEAMEDETYRYSETRAIVKEVAGKIAGVAFGYPAADEQAIDNAWKTIVQKHHIAEPSALFTDPETLPNEWYLDSICVAADYRGQGIGKELLASVETTAQQSCYEYIGLCCDQKNPKAKKLYERFGYRVVTTQQLSGHTYDHMQKKLSLS
ncbi:GNAT family N-acetyltransferase [Enterococcus bulliens]